MPRSGPRPYECVRKAWHSDTHQPIRGYLIQEIFRIANEIHSSAIKNNRQWQKKLPVVVLKAEEIIYSKANSEAEYTDFNTVWERANDAIDTIIRRDKTAETGHLIHPCVEAALHLGCTPRRFSRSQRNNVPQFYLTPEKNHECGDYVTNCSFMPGNSNLLSQRNTNSSVCIQDKGKSCSVFPLYYGTQFLPLEDSKTKTPSSHLNASNAVSTRTDFLGGCDLSLRLGPLSSTPEENIRPQESESRPKHMSSQMDIESCFIPTNKRDSKSQNLNEESTFTRKRKAVVSHPSKSNNNQHFCWH